MTTTDAKIHPVCAHCGTPLLRAVESGLCAHCADNGKRLANKFGTFRDRDGILHSCRYVGPVPPEDFNNEIVVNGLIYVDYCLDDGTPIKNAIIHETDFDHAH